MKLFIRTLVIFIYVTKISAAIRPDTLSEEKIFMEKLNAIFLPINNIWLRISHGFDEKNREEWESFYKSLYFFINTALSSGSLSQRASAAVGRKLSGDISIRNLEKQLTVFEESGLKIMGYVKGCLITGPESKRLQIIISAKNKLQKTQEELAQSKESIETELQKVRNSLLIPKEKGDALEVLVVVFEHLSTITQKYIFALENLIDYINKIELRSGTLFSMLSKNYPTRLDAKKELLERFNNFNKEIVQKIPDSVRYKLEDIKILTGEIIDNLNTIIIGTRENAAKNINRADYFENNALVKIQVWSEKTVDDAKVMIMRNYGNLLKTIDYFEGKDVPDDIISYMLRKYLQELKTTCDKINPDFKKYQYRRSINKRAA